MKSSAVAGTEWQSVCEFDELLPYGGVCAWLDGRQIAIFRVEESVYAIDNYDPASGSNVLARGIVGDIGGELVVTSPLYKQHFSLITGRCVEDPDRQVAVYPARVVAGHIWVRSEPVRQRRAPGKRRLVVIGNGMAGMRTVEELLTLAPNSYDITVFGAEPHGNYNRILLSPVLCGEKRVEDIVLHSLEWYERNGITLYADDPIVAIDRRRRIVRSRSGVEVRYDRLLLATGSNPLMPPIPGNTLPGVVSFRDLQDVSAMIAAAGRYRKATVIGGGLLGLEAANGLLRQGMQVTVVHIVDTLMERQLDSLAAGLLRNELRERGIAFRMPARTTAIIGSERATALQFDDDSTLPTDLVVMAAGIRPNIGLAQQSGLRCERGVLVDDTMQTYDPAIYAVGECVQHRNSTYGLVAPLWEQARVCATHLAEIGVTRYRGSLVSTQLKVTGIDVFSAGDFIGNARSESLVLRDAKRGVYKRLIIEDNKVRGAVLYGDTADGPWYFELMTQAKDVGAMRDKLIFGAAFAETSQ
ncbi:MAG TPA: nitrite reductase small subunit NirD [Steroidobacteraceae bacterium]|jgi:nitrite reductase (NADH) large subunit